MGDSVIYSYFCMFFLFAKLDFFNLKKYFLLWHLGILELAAWHGHAPSQFSWAWAWRVRRWRWCGGHKVCQFPTTSRRWTGHGWFESGRWQRGRGDGLEIPGDCRPHNWGIHNTDAGLQAALNLFIHCFYQNAAVLLSFTNTFNRWNWIV